MGLRYQLESAVRPEVALRKQDSGAALGEDA
jgi:hypothetical protein